jgi:predicted transcriptional regulator
VENITINPLSESQERILALLERSTLPLTRTEIMLNLDLARTTAYDSLTNLIDRGLIQKFARSNGLRGRANVYYEVV